MCGNNILNYMEAVFECGIKKKSDLGSPNAAINGGLCLRHCRVNACSCLHYPGVCCCLYNSCANSQTQHQQGVVGLVCVEGREERKREGEGEGKREG